MCSVFWWVQVDLEAASQQVGALASFWPFRQFLVRPGALFLHDDHLYASSGLCLLPSPPGNRSRLLQAAGRKRDGWGHLTNSKKLIGVDETLYVYDKNMCSNSYVCIASTQSQLGNGWKEEKLWPLAFMWQFPETSTRYTVCFQRQEPADNSLGLQV